MELTLNIRALTGAVAAVQPCRPERTAMLGPHPAQCTKISAASVKLGTQAAREQFHLNLRDQRHSE